MPCGPLGFAGGTNILYRNRGDGTFDDVSEASGIARPRGPASMVVRAQQLAADRLLRHGRGGGRFRQRRLARHLRRVRHRAQPALSQQPRRHVPRDRGAGRLRVRRERRRAGRHGRRRRRLRRRRLARHRPHELLRAGDHAVPELRRRASRTPASRPASASIASTSASASASSTSTTTAGRTSSSPTVTSTRRSPTRKLHITYRQPKLLYRNLGNGRFEDVSSTAGAGHHAPRTSGAAARSATSTTTATSTSSSTIWTGRRRCCATTAATGNNWLLIKCVGTRSNRSAIGARVTVTSRRPQPDRRGDERLELLLAERLPPALRPGPAAKADTRRDRLAVRA